jgi:hypothetical protein
LFSSRSRLESVSFFSFPFDSTIDVYDNYFNTSLHPSLLPPPSSLLTKLSAVHRATLNPKWFSHFVYPNCLANGPMTITIDVYDSDFNTVGTISRMIGIIDKVRSTTASKAVVRFFFFEDSPITLFGKIENRRFREVRFFGNFGNSSEIFLFFGITKFFRF